MLFVVKLYKVVSCVIKCFVFLVIMFWLIKCLFNICFNILKLKDLFDKLIFWYGLLIGILFVLIFIFVDGILKILVNCFVICLNLFKLICWYLKYFFNLWNWWCLILLYKKIDNIGLLKNKCVEGGWINW